MYRWFTPQAFMRTLGRFGVVLFRLVHRRFAPREDVEQGFTDYYCQLWSATTRNNRGAPADQQMGSFIRYGSVGGKMVCWWSRPSLFRLLLLEIPVTVVVRRCCCCCCCCCPAWSV